MSPLTEPSCQSPRPRADGQQSAVSLGGYAREEVSSLQTTPASPIRTPTARCPLCWGSRATAHLVLAQPRHVGPHKGPWSSWSLWGDPPTPLLGRGALWSEDLRAPGKRHRSRGGRLSLAALFRGRKRQGQSLLSARHCLHHLFQRNTEVVRLTVESGWWWKGGGC